MNQELVPIFELLDDEEWLPDENSTLISHRTCGRNPLDTGSCRCISASQWRPVAEQGVAWNPIDLDLPHSVAEQGVASRACRPMSPPLTLPS